VKVVFVFQLIDMTLRIPSVVLLFFVYGGAAGTKGEFLRCSVA